MEQLPFHRPHEESLSALAKAHLLVEVPASSTITFFLLAGRHRPPSLAEKNFPKLPEVFIVPVAMPTIACMEVSLRRACPYTTERGRSHVYCSIRAVATGFKIDHVTYELITAKERHRLLGQCIEGNIANAFSRRFMLPPQPTPPFSG